MDKIDKDMIKDIISDLNKFEEFGSSQLDIISECILNHINRKEKANKDDKSDDMVKNALNNLCDYSDEVIFKAVCLYYNSDLYEDKNDISKLAFSKVDNAWQEYISNDFFKLISEPISDAMDNIDFDILSDYIYEAIDDLDNYDFVYHLRKSLGLENKEEIKNIKELIEDGDVDKLLSFFEEMKDDDHLSYLMEINTFPSSTYENIVEYIIPSLKEIKEQEKDHDIGD